MSKKPEGIPEGIWAAAKEAIQPWLGPSHQYRDDCQEYIAHAIMAAIAVEREACAKGAERKYFPGRIGITGPSPEAIAAAIRQRGQE